MGIFGGTTVDIGGSPVVPASRVELFKKLKPLEIKECPFANLPEKKAGRWGAGLTAGKMEECRWLKPVTVAQFEFVEFTPEGHLRHSRFVALRDDKKAKDVGGRADFKKALIQLYNSWS